MKKTSFCNIPLSLPYELNSVIHYFAKFIAYSIFFISLLKMQIFIILDSRNHITLDVNPNDNILSIKTQIQKINGIKVNQQQLLYDGKCLLDDKTLKNYSIKNDSSIRFHVLPEQIQIYLKSFSQTINISINPYLPISHLKQEISKRVGYKPCEILLFFNDKIIEDYFSLNDYSIQKGSVVRFLKRLTGGKPNIYLYPEVDDCEIKVKIDMKKEDGEITIRYPTIEEKDQNTWIVKANKNGEMKYKNRTHYYLFWECLFNDTFNIDEGFLIEGSKCVEFFEDKLKYLGLIEKESNDFITYWCPKMIHSNYVIIKFQDEEYEKRAPLIIEPKPDFIKRIFITFRLLDTPINIPIQNIEKFQIKERKGFYAIEWGGSQIDFI